MYRHPYSYIMVYVRQSKNNAAKRTKLNQDYIVMKKVELYVLDKEENRKRVRVEYPIELSEDDIEDILLNQTTEYTRVDGQAAGYVPLIRIQQRTTK